MGGNGFWREAINGHPAEALGQHSSFAQAIDGQPAAALGFGAGDKTSGSPAAPVAAPQMAPATVPSANGFMPVTPNLNNVAQNPNAANPLVANAPIAAAQVPNNASQQPVMAQIQHPEFQNFISSVMNNVNQSNQPGGS